MNDLNLWLLLGIAIVIVGFILKIDSIAVVIFAAVVTALIGGMNFTAILETIGKAFVDGRGTSIFILTLPIIGISERYGLREQAVKIIQKVGSLTAGRVAWFYNVIRQISGALSLRLGGHPQFVRPLIHPMAEAAAVKDMGGSLDEKSIEDIKAATSAADNYGNFFGQNLFSASSGVALIVQTLSEQNISVANSAISLWSVPVFVIVIIMSFFQFTLLDSRIRRRGGKS